MHFVRTLNYDLSWVALQGMAHVFTELQKLLHHDEVMIHEGGIYPREIVTFRYTQNVYVSVHSIFILCNQILETLMCLIVGEWLNNCGMYIPWNNIEKQKGNSH